MATTRKIGSKQPGRKRPRSRQQTRVRETRARLLQAAREVFAERGFDLTTVDQITERADLGKGTFYYHFGSKEKLIGHLMGSVLAELGDRVQERCAGISNLPEVLNELIGAHIEFFASRWGDFVLYYQGRSDLTLQEGYAGIETPFVVYLRKMEDLLGGVLHVALPQLVLRRVACAVAGFISGYYSFAVIATPDDNIDETIAVLRGAIVESLNRFIQAAVREASQPSGSEV